MLKVRHQYIHEIEEKSYEGKYKKCATNIYMKLRKKATRENIKSAPTIYTWNWGKKLRGKILKVRQQYLREIEERNYEGKY
jgi:hypothetical protein